MNALEQLFDETRLLWHQLVRVVETPVGGGGTSAGQRAVLEFISVHGPTPVPAIARARGVTRQHVQTLVNELLAGGLVRLLPNPAHRRSPLVQPTAAGASTLARARRREGQVLRRLAPVATEVEVERAAATLRRLRQALRRQP